METPDAQEARLGTLWKLVVVMPTKAQLEAQLSDYDKMERKLQARIADLEDQNTKLEADVEEARAYLRPFFVPRAAGPIPIKEGTAHCPVCNACAPGMLKLSPDGVALVVTARPITHNEGCYFAEQLEQSSVPCALTGPDGEQLNIDLRDIVHMEPRINYTTLIVKDGTSVRRVVVCEKVNDIRARRRRRRRRNAANAS